MRGRWKLVGAVAVLVVVLSGCNSIRRVSSSTYQDGVRCMEPAVSADGRWTAFSTLGDPSGIRHDQQTILRGLTGSSSRQLAGYGSYAAPGSLSADGGVAVFLISVPLPEYQHEERVYLWSRASGTRTQVSVAGQDAYGASVSDDGTRVAYATNDGIIWLYDLRTHKHTRMSAIPSSSDVGYQAGQISGDGRYVTFSRLHPSPQLYVHEISSGTTWTLLSKGDYAEATRELTISDSGRYVAFAKAHNGQLGSASNIYVWDRTTKTSKRFTAAAQNQYAAAPTISGDGSRVVFSELVPGTTHNDLRMLDRASGKVTTAATASHYLGNPVLSRTGHTMVFCTDSPELVAGSPHAPNVYVWNDGPG